MMIIVINISYINIINIGIVCHDGDVRLVNESQPNEGIVEVCFNETWGTICAIISHRHYWNQSEANVVCRQLGYPGARELTKTYNYYLMYFDINFHVYLQNIPVILLEVEVCQH